MSPRKLPFVMVATLLLGVAALGLVPAANAVPSNDQGCYCHNNGIGVWLDGTGFAEYGGMNFTAGGTGTLNVTSANIAATGIVPGIQEWLTNTTDTGQFTFQPQMVQDGSPQDHDAATGNITGIYTITAPSAPGSYTLTIYVQGTTVAFTATVTGGSTGTTTTSTGSGSSGSTSQTTTTTTSKTTSTTKTSTQDWLAGFPGLNLITLYITAGTALVIGVVLGIGVALRARKVRPGIHESS